MLNPYKEYLPPELKSNLKVPEVKPGPPQISRMESLATFVFSS